MQKKNHNTRISTLMMTLSKIMTLSRNQTKLSHLTRYSCSKFLHFKLKEQEGVD